MSGLPDLIEGATGGEGDGPIVEVPVNEEDLGEEIVGDEWADWVEEAEPVDVKCLFCEETLNGVPRCFKHCRRKHKFDLVSFMMHCNMDHVDYIKIINFIRKTSPNPRDLHDNPEHYKEQFNRDEYMIPTLENDPLLQYDVEDLEEDFIGNDSTLEMSDLRENDEEDEKYADLVRKAKDAERRTEEAEFKLMQAMQDINKMRDAAKTMISQHSLVPMPSHDTIQNLKDGEDDGYFDGYGHFAIHEEMLKDKVRTEYYRDCIYNNAELFKDKVVLDIGCGTGILSMFAAKSGARLVIGVDNSDIIIQAMDIIRENGLEHKITLVKGRMEEVQLPVEKVDIIISEWMGYFLLFESMLDTILWARDRFLAPGGRIIPDSCNISIAGLSDPALYESHVKFWDDVYGFKMTCMKGPVVKEGSIQVVKPERVSTSSAVIKEIDICSCSTKDLEFTSPFTLLVKSEQQISAFVAYFDISWKNCNKQMSFSTSPQSPATHWKQTVFLLENPVTLKAGESLEGQLICRKSRRGPRNLAITISFRGETFKYTLQ